MEKFRIAIVMDDMAAERFAERAGYDFGDECGVVTASDVRHPAHYVQSLIGLYGHGFTIKRATQPRRQDSFRPEEKIDILYVIGFTGFPASERASSRNRANLYANVKDVFGTHIDEGNIPSTVRLARAVVEEGRRIYAEVERDREIREEMAFSMAVRAVEDGEPGYN